MKDRTKAAGRVRLVRVALGDLAPAPYNPRRMKDATRAGVAASLDRFGLVQPLVVNRRTEAKGWPPGSAPTVVAGHQRRELLIKAGASETDAVFVDLTPVEEKALNVALNSPRLAGEFTDALGPLLEEISGALPELSSALLLPGMVADVGALSAKAGADLSAISEAALTGKPPAVTRPGDVWGLGAHRLICGDATKAATVERLLEGAKADLVYTDPPYGLAYRSTSGKHAAIEGDALTRDDLLKILVPSLTLAAQHSTDAAAFYIWHAVAPSTAGEDVAYAIKAAGLQQRNLIVWAKPSLVLGHADYQQAHESCFYCAKAGKNPAWYGGREQVTVWRLEQRGAPDSTAVVLGPGLVVSDGTGAELYLAPRPPKERKVRSVRVPLGEKVLVRGGGATSTLWEVARDSAVPEHPTQKPVALAARALANSSKEGDRVLDLFAGAGATVLAAEQMRRVAYLAELEPHFVDVIVRRWETLTGRKAKREAAPAPRGARGKRSA